MRHLVYANSVFSIDELLEPALFSSAVEAVYNNDLSQLVLVLALELPDAGVVEAVESRFVGPGADRSRLLFDSGLSIQQQSAT